MSLAGIHLTRIGATDFLLEPLRSLNISDSAKLVEGVVERLLQAGASRLYYDLSTQAIIDPVYYKWLNQLARTVAADQRQNGVRPHAAHRRILAWCNSSARHPRSKPRWI